MSFKSVLGHIVVRNRLIVDKLTRHVMKKGWIIALALLLIGGLGAYIWYQRLQRNATADGGPYDNTLKPRLEMSRVSITDISKEAISLNLHLLIDNPLPVSFTAHQLDYSLAIAGQEVMHDAYKKPISIKSGDSTVVTLPVKLLGEKLVKTLKRLEDKGIDSTDYTVRSSFALDVPLLGKKTFAVTTVKKLPVLYIPQVNVDDIDLGHIGLGHTDLAAKVSIENKNKFSINLTNVHYTVKIDGKLISEGDPNGPVLIKKQATTPVVFPVTMKPGKALGLLPKALFDKKDTPYEVYFTAKIKDKGGNPMIDDSKIASTITGTLADFKKSAKK